MGFALLNPSYEVTAYGHIEQNGRRGRRQLNVLGARLPSYQTKISLLRRLLALGVGVALSGENLLGDQTGVLPDRGLDLG
jgi:hypothetical protein